MRHGLQGLGHLQLLIMLPEALHLFRILGLGVGLLSQRLALALGHHQSRLSIRFNDLNLRICVDMVLLLVCLGHLQDLGGFLLGPSLGQHLLILCFDDLNRLLFQRMNLPPLLERFHLDFFIQKLDLLHVELMLKLEHDLHIVSLQFQ